MNTARPLALLSVLSLLALAHCGDANKSNASASAVKDASSAKPAGSGSAKPASSAGASSAAAPAATTAAASAVPSAASAPAAGEDLTGEAFLKLLKLPEGSKAQSVPGMEGFGFLGPADTKLADVGAGRPKKWGTTSFGGMTMATLLVNHEQDEGEKCMKLADAKAKLGSAKIVKEQTFSIPVVEKDGKYTDYGDEAAELLVFERDGKQGFYAHKVFDHGDDATRICCTAGAAADAKELKGSADAAQIEAMSAVCLSWSFKF
jgi:hypothetical protein